MEVVDAEKALGLSRLEIDILAIAGRIPAKLIGDKMWLSKNWVEERENENR
jgi:hypothetical protein